MLVCWIWDGKARQERRLTGDGGDGIQVPWVSLDEEQRDAARGRRSPGDLGRDAGGDAVVGGAGEGVWCGLSCGDDSEGRGDEGGDEAHFDGVDVDDRR